MEIIAEAYKDERLKGARIMVVFRWSFILLLGILLAVQYASGYHSESFHALRLLGIYLAVNLFFTMAVFRRYDPAWVRYAGAVSDMGIVLYHLHYQSLYYDPIAISAASTLFLIPFLFLLYTLRLDRKLLLFIIILGVTGLGGIYAYHYSLAPEVYAGSLSLSPLAQGFKMSYILFLGIMCLYHQYSIYRFIEKQLENLRYQSDLTMQITLEKQKSAHAKELEEINAGLEETIQKRTRELSEARTRVLQLEKENLQSQFEVLKQQVNPHFLFNSLNVLSSLIRIDPAQAVRFTGQLSRVYRYALESREKDLVPVATEMEFLNAYNFLMDIRFRDKVIIHNHLADLPAEGLVPPQVLQLLVENAIKHNTFSKKKPLVIDISMDEQGWLKIVNNLQSRDTMTESTGVGLANIRRRYTLLSPEEPSFEATGGDFVARIPLIKNSTDKEKNQKTDRL